MKNITINVKRLNLLPGAIVLVDDKEIKFKKDKFENLSYKFNTDKDNVNIKVVSVNELDRKYWLIYILFYWFISIFGILNPPFEKYGYVINYNCNYLISKNETIELYFNYPKANKKLLQVKEENNMLDNETNIIIQDEKIYKRAKFYKKFKIAMLVLIAIAIIASVVAYFVIKNK